MAIANSLLDQKTVAGMSEEQLQLIGQSVLAEAVHMAAGNPAMHKQLQDRAESLAKTVGRSKPG